MMSFDQAVASAAGLAAVAIGGWALRTLYSVVRLVDKIEERVTGHTDRHDEHDARHEKLSEKHGALDLRVARIEASGCSVKGQCLPRPG